MSKFAVAQIEVSLLLAELGDDGEILRLVPASQQPAVFNAKQAREFFAGDGLEKQIAQIEAQMAQQEPSQ